MDRNSTGAVTADTKDTRAEAGVHHFTVDVEEHFQVSAFEAHVDRSAWDALESRVEDSTDRILSLMEESGATGTFFVLGWVAERHPALVRRIVEGGHEVASHGHAHERVTTLTPDAFRTSIRHSKRVLEDAAGEEVLGYRAPSFSIVPGLEWALDVLLEEGYRYDSSLYPVRRRGYGYPQGSPDPWWIERPSGRLLEIPPTTVGVAALRLPAGGGGTFRHLPYGLARAGLRQAAARGAPGTFYIHPWEVDPDQPPVPVPWLTRRRHYGGLEQCAGRLRRLLGEFRFRPIRATFAAAGA